VICVDVSDRPTLGFIPQAYNNNNNNTQTENYKKTLKEPQIHAKNTVLWRNSLNTQKTRFRYGYQIRNSYQVLFVKKREKAKM